MEKRDDSLRDAGPEDGGRSGKLRDFSAHLAARLQAAPGPLREPARLAVRIGAAAFLLDMNGAGEIISAPGITPVPWTKPWFLGLSNVRGRLVGVIDLMRLAGDAPLAAEDGQQLIVCNENMKYNIALLITRAYGLRNVSDLEPLGPIRNPARPWEAQAFRDTDGTRLVEIDLGALASFEEFTSIGV